MSLLARLKGSNAAWQYKMAKRMSGLTATPRNESHAADRGWKLIVYPRHLAWAAAGLILVAFAVWWLSIRLDHKQADDLLATVYYRHRPIELRIQEASHPSFEGVRGNDASQIKDDPAFRQAGHIISEGLAKYPNDPAWLQTEGRYQLLLGNYDDAIRNLQQALDIRPDFIPASVDLASSYVAKHEGRNAGAGIAEQSACEESERGRGFVQPCPGV
jgi:tetratricopeptide (TPR) repeat protein